MAIAAFLACCLLALRAPNYALCGFSVTFMVLKILFQCHGVIMLGIRCRIDKSDALSFCFGSYLSADIFELIQFFKIFF